MKKIVALLLILSLLIPFVCMGNMSVFADLTSSSSENPDEDVPDWPVADDLGGYENINLTYTFKYSRYSQEHGALSKSDFAPYVAYLDKSGNIKDYFFDSYLFLPRVTVGPSGNSMQGGTTKAIDWTTYVNNTFYSGKNVDALNAAFGDVKEELGDADKKAGVFFSILYPNKYSADFGSLGGRSLDFTKVDNQKYAIKWIIDEQIKLFNQRNYQNLELVGFYWYEESLSSSDINLFKYASDYLHTLGLKIIWIPYYRAEGYNKISQLGADAVCMQPNLFWMAYSDPNRVNDSIEYSKKYGMGMEIELDYRASQDYYFNRYLYYLESGMNSGIMNAVKMYYQDAGPGVYYDACYSNNSNYRNVYDLTYKYAKGTLTQADIDAVRPQGVDDNFVDDINFDKILKSADWISIGKTYTGCPSYVDGNGSAYQNVSGKELTDGIIASGDLSTDWFAFHKSNLDDEGRMSITIDLGEVRSDIKHFAAHFDNKHLYAIGAPIDIKVYTSMNGRDFRLFDTAKLILDSEYSCFYMNERTAMARYVKLSIGDISGLYAFCSEFLVGIDHVHKPSEEWSGDETHHWHQCRCDEKFDTAEHTAGDWDIIKEAEIGVEGKKELRCTVCELIISTETIPAIEPEEDSSVTPPDTSHDNSDASSGDSSEPSDDQDPEILLGDINQNGKIDMTDYILLKRAYFNTYKLNETQNIFGDINQNHKIDMTDYILLKRIYFGTYTVK